MSDKKSPNKRPFPGDDDAPQQPSMQQQQQQQLSLASLTAAVANAAAVAAATRMQQQQQQQQQHQQQQQGSYSARASVLKVRMLDLPIQSIQFNFLLFIFIWGKLIYTVWRPIGRDILLCFLSEVPATF